MNKKAFLGYVKVSLITVAAMLAVYFICSLMVQRTVVSGDSMYPTLMDDEGILVNKLAYINEDIDRFDVVIFTHYNNKLEKEVYYVKRVIGLPGESILIDNGAIYINGELLEEYYGYYDTDLPSYSGIAEETINIGEDEYFVLGDNRNNSEDSRSFGCVSEEVVTGKVAFRIFPLSRIGKVR